MHAASPTHPNMLRKFLQATRNPRISTQTPPARVSRKSCVAQWYRRCPSPTFQPARLLIGLDTIWTRSEGNPLRRAANFDGGAGNRTRVRKAYNSPSFTCVVAVSPSTGSVNSVTTYSSLISVTLSRTPSRNPALVVDTLRIPERSLRQAAIDCFSGSESVCVVVRTYDVPLDRRSRSRRHADESSVPTSKPIAPS